MLRLRRRRPLANGPGRLKDSIPVEEAVEMLPEAIER